VISEPITAAARPAVDSHAQPTPKRSRGAGLRAGHDIAGVGVGQHHQQAWSPDQYPLAWAE